MSGSIKGITIEIAGDTTKLDKALRDIAKSTRDIDKELRAVTNDLKFNPTSVELWRQKQTLLTSKISETEKKLQVLKQAQAKMDAQGVDKNSEEYRKLQREIISTESKLKTFKSQLASVGNVKLKVLSEQFKDVGNKLTTVGNALKGVSAAAAVVVATMTGAAIKSGKWADDLNTMSKQYGISVAELQKYQRASDLVDVSVETMAKSHTKLTKSMSNASDGSKKQAEAFKQLGVNVTNSDGSLRDTNEVFDEVIAALGKMDNATERDALAMKIFGKSAQELNPLIADGGETYKKVADIFEKYGLEPVDQESIDKANQFNDSLNTIKMIGQTTFATVGAKIAEALAPALEKLVDLIGQVAGWISNLSPQVLAVIGVIASVVAVLAPVLLILGKIAFAISSIMSVMGTVGPVIAAISGPIGIAIAVIAALVAIGILLYKNWDKIKAKAIQIKTAVVNAFNAMKQNVANAFNAIKQTASKVWNGIKSTISNVVGGIKNKVSSAFNAVKNVVTRTWSAIKSATSSAWNAVKNAIMKPINSAVSLVRGAVNKIKSAFKFKISFPKFKLPHFTITGKFKLNPPSVPKFGVKWYDQGGIFDSPTVIGVGEKRPEFVGALDDLRKIVREESGGQQITINVYGTNNMSPAELAKEVERRLIESQKRRRLSWQ